MATRRLSANETRPLGKALSPTVHPSLQMNRAADLSSDSEDEEKLDGRRLTPGNPEASWALLERRDTVRRNSHGDGATTVASDGTTVCPRPSLSHNMDTTHRGSLDPSVAARRRGSVADRKAHAQEVVQTRRASGEEASRRASGEAFRRASGEAFRRASGEASRRSSTAEHDENEDAVFVSVFPARTGERRPSLAVRDDVGDGPHRPTSNVSFAPSTGMEAGGSRRQSFGNGTADSGVVAVLLPAAVRGPVNSATYPHGDASYSRNSYGPTASPNRFNSATATRSASAPHVGAVVPGYKFGEGGSGVLSKGKEAAAHTRDKLRTLTNHHHHHHHHHGAENADAPQAEGDLVEAPDAAAMRRGTTAKTPVMLPGGIETPMVQSPTTTRVGVRQEGKQWYEMLLGPTLLERGRPLPTQAFVAREQYRYIALYFSAGWCPPCIEFTRILHRVYGRLESEGFGLIFVSADPTQQKYDEHCRTMPWAAVPWRKDLHKIDEHFGVMGIPKVIVLFPDDGTIATREAATFMMDGDAELTLLMAAVRENTRAVQQGGDPSASSAGAGQTARHRDQVKESCALM